MWQWGRRFVQEIIHTCWCSGLVLAWPTRSWHRRMRSLTRYGVPQTSTICRYAAQLQSSSTVCWDAVDMSLRIAVTRIRREVRVWSLVLKDPRTPRVSKWLLGAAVVYLVSPVDLIPDFIPVLGQLDDLVIVRGLVWLAMRSIPREIVADCTEKARRQENSLPPIGVDP